MPALALRWGGSETRLPGRIDVVRRDGRVHRSRIKLVHDAVLVGVAAVHPVAVLVDPVAPLLPGMWRTIRREAHADPVNGYE